MACNASWKSPVLTLEVEPRNQLLSALGLLQIQRQDLRGEEFTFLSRSAIMHPRLANCDLAQTRDQLFARAGSRCEPPRDTAQPGLRLLPPAQFDYSIANVLHP
jgi:hypothetical protein